MSEPYVKDPYDKEDYSVDYSDWIGAEDISTSTWAVTPSGPTLSGDTYDNTEKTATVIIDGGTHGINYKLTNSIITSTGKKKRRTIDIHVRYQ